MVDLAEAKNVLRSSGWLSRQPEPFQEAILRRSGLMRFVPGDSVYRLGDGPGGLYGLVRGAVAITAGRATETPRLGHIALPGSWIGIGGFFSRGARRIGMQAAVETWMMHLPLEAMDRMEREDPSSVRAFAQILMGDFDTVLSAFLSLQKKDADRRVASTLLRLCLGEGTEIPLSQTELGTLSNTSRKHVNAALQRFEAEGWLSRGYRTITIRNLRSLARYVASDEIE